MVIPSFQLELASFPATWQPQSADSKPSGCLAICKEKVKSFSDYKRSKGTQWKLAVSKKKVAKNCDKSEREQDVGISIGLME